MIAPTAPHARSWTAAEEAPSGDRLGFLFPLLAVWTVFEFARPSNAFRIPLVISVISCAGWVFNARKQWSKQSTWMLAFLGGMALGAPLARNNFEAAFYTWRMSLLFFCVCLPLQSQVTSVRRIRVWIYAFLGVSLYVGGWAVTHQGYGPSGAEGAQDENYIAAHMAMAIPLAYFGMFADKRLLVRVVLALSILVFCGAMVIQQNPSRGGFLGLIAVAAYCLWRSPNKMLGLTVVVIMGMVALAFAGPAYWKEISTSGDYETGTGGLRLEVWTIGLKMWLSNPLFGVGAGNFPYRIGSFQTMEQYRKFSRILSGMVAHSLPVELLAELGIAGVIPVVVIFGRTWRDLGRLVTRGPASGESATDPDLVALRYYADGIRASMLAILVCGLFLSLLYYSHIWLLVAVGAAMTYVYQARLRAVGPSGERARPTERRPGMRGGMSWWPRG